MYGKTFHSFKNCLWLTFFISVLSMKGQEKTIWSFSFVAQRNLLA